MVDVGAQVSSEALQELQSSLKQLSQTLHEIYDLMNADMTAVGEFWRDPKYEQFVESYRPKINKCEEISERYNEWCGSVLDPLIEKVIKIEDTDVSGDGGSISVGGAVSTEGTQGQSAPVNKVDRFKKVFANSPIAKKWREEKTHQEGMDPHERVYPHLGEIIQEEKMDRIKEAEEKKKQQAFNLLLARNQRGR